VELYLYSPIRLHGMVLSFKGSDDILLRLTDDATTVAFYNNLSVHKLHETNVTISRVKLRN
jgi:hypothetical protein